MVAMQIVVPKYDSKSGRPKMVIMGSNNDMFVVPWAPRDVTHGNIGENVSNIERAGRVDDIGVKSPKLPTMSFTLMLGRRIDVSCEPDIVRLENIVNAGGWIQILYGPKESGLWKCTDFSWASIEREPISNQVSRASVEFAFSAVPDSRQVVGQYSIDFNFRGDAATESISQQIVTAARNQRARTPVAPSGGGGGVVGGNTGQAAGTVPPYIVQAGDSLMSIATKFYGQYAEQFWRLIGDYNKVAGSLNIGQILRIP